jgi:hypothetical protein
MVQLSRESFILPRTCGGRMVPAHEARDDGYRWISRKSSP